ncbi:hypothetical protein EMIHUDRAFT_241350 [Emiliania huxleyi CCMP1516]|uniref:Uncharacterized protein n=2 Tax=Emiliania huxleyi TaxID=2903 RepID=A0A0D3JCS2_EMIH1|nr:hypothetical protein EMIHUDRAFT_241350 [Emiliania huxleyi CCMP1516]EOD21307.1 hypothetical protein EMIHUDRAFT_241350 [Emiliania huxleyi CCMP1516]|eukprot:XP_005773736.1 hypothetical protein EMIHUDRAFT_241350 [Emiliania huxleyi CCMP1516]
MHAVIQRSETTPGPTVFGFVASNVRFNTRSRARVCWRPENMLHHMLPAEPNCLHSTRQSIHSRQLKSNFHSMRLAPDCELGERALQLRPQWLSSARARSPELGAAGGHGQQQRFDASLGAGGQCSGGAVAVRRARDGLQLHWQLPERVWSAAIV